MFGGETLQLGENRERIGQAIGVDAGAEGLILEVVKALELDVVVHRHDTASIADPYATRDEATKKWYAEAQLRRAIATLRAVA